MPMVITLAHNYRRSPSKLLIPLSYGAQLGGVITLIGTSTNVLASALAAERGYGAFGMFDFTGIGVLVYLTGLLYFLLLGRRLLPERRSNNDVAVSYELKGYLAEIRCLKLRPKQPLLGTTLLGRKVPSRI
jgi:di/tricarboxylate transporter